MYTLIRRYVAHLLACLIALSLQAAAQDTGGMKQPEIQTSTAVRIELIAQPREVELPSRFHLAMRLVNNTDSSVIFRSFALTPLEEPGGLQVAPDCKNQKQVAIDKHSSFTITCEVSSKYFDDSIPRFPEALFGSWSLLTLQAGEYRFVATAQVRLNEESVIATSETVPVRIRPTVWQICAGAALGALFLVLFTFSSTKARSVFLKRERLETMGGWRLWFAEPVLLWVGATLAASIFIFLTYRLKDVASPITVSVNDFYGGMVFGLFGVFIADGLAARLYARAEGRDGIPAGDRSIKAAGEDSARSQPPKQPDDVF